MIEEKTIEQLIRKCYDIMGVPQPTDEDVQNVEHNLRIAVKYGKLNRSFCRIKEREMQTKYPKKLRRAWKSFKRKVKRYYNALQPL